MSRRTFRQANKKGSILALVVIVIVFLSVIGVGMLQCGLQARVYAARQANEIAAQVAADAGLERAVWQLNQNVQAKYSAETLPKQADLLLANSQATYSYEIAIPNAGTLDLAGDAQSLQLVDPFTVRLSSAQRYTIRSVGKSGSAQKVLYGTVRLKGLFDSAILSKGKISLMPNTLISGYNSADPTDTDIDVAIGTISTLDDSITLGPGSVVEGDVFVGLGGNPLDVIGAGGTINGQKYALTETIQFPVITIPLLADYGTVITAKGETLKLTPADNGTYNEIKLSSQAGIPGRLEINGSVVLHLTGDINLGNDAEIVIKNGSSLVLYADSDISTGNSAGFVNENTPPQTLKVFATGEDPQDFELKAKSSVFGEVYAPNADIELYPNAELYGAIVGNSVSIKSGGTFMYDEALRNVEPEDEGARFTIERWWE
ncbi:MAG: hypothetical protein JXN61_03075 [Sedimentisphaerales bacterium]|nr:hypothetical protein [Sedimentisphaerales bacterium]